MEILETISLMILPVWIPLRFLLSIIEKVMFVMILLYDSYCYSPLQTALSPLVAMVPRTLHVGTSTVTVFTANIVSWARTLLVIPIAICLKYDYVGTACVCVIVHDFLDHLDGIVAKTQRRIYGDVDDSLLGGFMDAFCDKIMNCLSLWTILMVTDFTQMSIIQAGVFLVTCSIIIAYEFVLGVVRVQDYFAAHYQRKYNDVSTYQPNIAAAMEGKLKEKLESVGIACLCLCQGASNPVESISGIVGLICLLLSIRLAHASLMHKLAARWASVEATEGESQTEADKGDNRATPKQTTATQTEPKKASSIDYKRRQSSLYDDLSDGSSDDNENSDMVDVFEKDVATVRKVRALSDASDGPIKVSEVGQHQVSESGQRRRTLSRSKSVPSWGLLPAKVDKVYTIGCFDLFHEGHEILMKRLKQLGTQVIVGVHDSRSIFKLKKKVPIDSTSRRMFHVKKYADMAFCIHGTDPSPYIQCIFDQTEGVSSLYVRGDDMKNFPSRDVTEAMMPVHFLPYTPTVSSTKLRKEIYNASQFGPHVNHDDHTMFY